MEARLRPKYNNQDWEANQEQNVFCGAACRKRPLLLAQLVSTLREFVF